MKRHALDFGTNFAAYDRMTSITNSMHVLVCHVPAYIAAGLKVDAFSQQGVEMAVGVRQRRVKSHISRNTSIQGQSYPGQLMALIETWAIWRCASRGMKIRSALHVSEADTQAKDRSFVSTTPEEVRNKE